MMIRPAKYEDSSGIARVQVDSYQTAYAGIFPSAYLDHFTYEEQTQDWQEILSSETTDKILVSTDPADKIVAYALGRPFISDLPPYDSERVALHVRPEYQKQGIGKRLIATIAEALSESGCQSLFLWVLARNPACQFYEKLGGERITEKPWQNNAYFKTEIVEVAYAWCDLHHLIRPGVMPTPQKRNFTS
jgi:GNAT superfamily N-acetyltransferase